MLKVAAVSASVAAAVDEEEDIDGSALVDVGDDVDVPVESLASAAALALRAASFSSACFFSRS